MDLTKIRQEIAEAEKKQLKALNFFLDKGKITYGKHTETNSSWDLTLQITQRGVSFNSSAIINDNDAKALRDVLIEIYGNPENETTDTHG